MSADDAETHSLLNCTSDTEREKLLAHLFLGHSSRLRSMVELRLDRRMRSRVDPSDVVQEVYLEALKRLKEYVERPSVPLYLWLRALAGQRLWHLHEDHIHAQKRTVRREVRVGRGSAPDTTSAVLATCLLDRSASSPSGIAMRAEAKSHVQNALERMDATDREVLALRYFEQLSTAEAAATLGMTKDALRKRHYRALKKLREALGAAGESLQGGD